MKKLHALLVTIALAASAAFAAPVAAQRSPGDVVVRSGGVGVEDRAALEAERTRYNLRLVGAAQAQPLVYLHWPAGVSGAGPGGRPRLAVAHAHYFDCQHHRADHVEASLDLLVDWRPAEAALERRPT